MGAHLSRYFLERDALKSLSPHQAQFLKVLIQAHSKGKTKQRGTIQYHLATIPWNLRCAPKPLAVVYALNAEEVSTVVTIAAKYGISVQPRSGGHSFGSYSLGGKDGALVVDLSKMNTVKVDQSTWKATIGGGTLLKKVTNELYNQGKRTIAHGTCPQVGIGGHATVGGQGPLSRMYGLTLDHVVEIEAVLADGSITRANKETNSDLFFVRIPSFPHYEVTTCHTYLTESPLKRLFEGLALPLALLPNLSLKHIPHLRSQRTTHFS